MVRSELNTKLSGRNENGTLDMAFESRVLSGKDRHGRV